MKTIEVINLMDWYQNEDTQKRLSTLPLKTQWVLRKNIKLLEPIFNNFNDFRNELIQKRNEEWFVEDNGKCERINENGEEMLRIKDEFLDQFQKSDDELNKQIKEIIAEENSLDFSLIDIDKLVNSIENDDNCKINISDLEMFELINVK